jgi:hypothetical protein
MISARGKAFVSVRPMFSARRGFSLVEMMIASFSAMIIFTVGFMIISGTIRAKNESSARIRATENARLFFQLLERDLAGAFPLQAGVPPVVEGIFLKEQLFSEYDITVGKNMSTGNNITVGTNVSTGNPIKIDNNNSLQFYTRIDGRGVTDGYSFVRYYINNKQQLCRQVIPFGDPNEIPTFEPIEDVLNLTDFAMFDRVRSMYVTFHKWDEYEKDYFPKLSSRDTLPKTPATPAGALSVQVSAATHIKVQLFLFDTLGTVRVDDGGEVRIVDQDVEKTDVDLSIRVMQKTLAIPSGFTN